MENDWKLSDKELKELREQTPEEKQFSDYLKSIGVTHLSLISEKTMSPRLLIGFDDGTTETYNFSNEEAKYLKNLDKFDWKYCLNKSERLKNKL